MKMHELIKEQVEQKGTYAAVTFDDDSNNMLTQFCQDNNIPNPVTDFHSTVVYSRNFIPEYPELGNIDPPWSAQPVGYEVWPSGPNAFKNDTTYCLVLRIECPELIERFNHIMENYDATYDYDEYKPHISLSYDVGEDFDPSSLPYPNAINVVKEYSEELKLGDD